jgi:hypothetical protein
MTKEHHVHQFASKAQSRYAHEPVQCLDLVTHIDYHLRLSIADPQEADVIVMLFSR